MTLQTSYEFTLPRGYVDAEGQVHRNGTMRLATARDELAPLRDPTITGPDDPRLTVLVLARVVESLGKLPRVTEFEIEGLFAVDLAFLQDFYGVINFGSQEEYEALVNAQQSTPLLGTTPARPAASPEPQSAPPAADAASEPAGSSAAAESARRSLRTAVEELPRRAQ